MARTHNPFAKKEASTLETPWGSFEIASPNKTRLALIESVQERLKGLGDEPPVSEVVAASMEMAGAGAVESERLVELLREHWEKDVITLAQLRGAAEFIAKEISEAADSGND